MVVSSGKGMGQVAKADCSKNVRAGDGVRWMGNRYLERLLRPPRTKAPNKPARTLSALRKRIASSESAEVALGEILDFAGTRCGAYARSTGKPCLGRRVPGRRRCRNHGGCSTGPKTLEGKLRALSNLKQFRVGA